MKLYVMSPKEFDVFRLACGTETLLIVEGGEVKSLDADMKAVAFWKALGTIHGFVWSSAHPEGSHPALFFAEPSLAPNQLGDDNESRPHMLN